jgi:hypothetical protein
MASKNPAAVALGKRRMALLTPEERQEFASKGGTKRLKKLSKAKRKAIAKKAAEARWKDKGK